MPNDDEVAKAISTRYLAKAKICNYLLVEYDKSIAGDNPSNPATIEHVLPQTIVEGSEWTQLFTSEQHKEYKDLIANLIPLSSPLNLSIQNASYTIKKERYARESMFKTPRSFSETYSVWNPDNLLERSKFIAEWVTNRWKN